MAKKEEIILTEIELDKAVMRKRYFRIKIRLTDKFLGTIPKDKSIYTTYIATKAPQHVAKSTKLRIELETKINALRAKSDGIDTDEIKALLKQIDNIVVDPNDIPEVEDIDNIEQRGWTGFFSEKDKGIYILNYMIMGFFKEAGNLLKEQVGIKNLKSKLENNVFISPRRIFVNKNEPDGCIERPLRGQTPQGQITSLVRSDYIDAGTEIEFSIILVENKEIKPLTLRTLMEYGNLKGLGQFRNGSYGRFEVISFAETNEVISI